MEISGGWLAVVQYSPQKSDAKRKKEHSPKKQTHTHTSRMRIKMGHRSGISVQKKEKKLTANAIQEHWNGGLIIGIFLLARITFVVVVVMFNVFHLLWYPFRSQRIEAKKCTFPEYPKTQQKKNALFFLAKRKTFAHEFSTRYTEMLVTILNWQCWHQNCTKTFHYETEIKNEMVSKCFGISQWYFSKKKKKWEESK